jgi:hypothetical protein
VTGLLAKPDTSPLGEPDEFQWSAQPLRGLELGSFVGCVEYSPPMQQSSLLARRTAAVDATRNTLSRQRHAPSPPFHHSSMLPLPVLLDETPRLLFRTMPRSTRLDIMEHKMMSGYSTRNCSLKEEARSMFKRLLAEDSHCSLATVLAVMSYLRVLVQRSLPLANHFTLSA